MNWQSEIEALMKLMSVKDISAKVGLAESSIYDIKNGYTKQPRGMAAIRLHELISAAKLGAGETADEQMKEAE